LPFIGLYSTGAAASVFDMWLAADEGDASGFALLSLGFNFCYRPSLPGVI